jgi:hypothetical protein
VTSRLLPVVVGLFASIGAWVVGKALGQRLAGGETRKEPEDPPPEPPQDVEDALEVPPRG